GRWSEGLRLPGSPAASGCRGPGPVDAGDGRLDAGQPGDGGPPAEGADPGGHRGQLAVRLPGAVALRPAQADQPRSLPAPPHRAGRAAPCAQLSSLTISAPFAWPASSGKTPSWPCAPP